MGKALPMINRQGFIW